MEGLAYAILLLLAVLYVILIIAGLISAMPYGIVGLIALLAVGLLFIKVLKERLRSAEDDYYEQNVDQ